MTTQERFSPGVDEQIRCYVYALIDPRDDEIFYVGKGTRNRCFAHVAEASSTRKISVDGYEKLDRIREIQNAGQRVVISLLRHGLTDAEALLVESAIIDALGLQGRDLTNRIAGHETRLQGRMSVEEVNAQYSVPATLDPSHRVMLITVNQKYEPGMSETALYEATRKFWRVAKSKRQIGSVHAPKWAVAVYRGVVRGVYRIEGWEQPTDSEISENPKRMGRWAFIGLRDQEMEERYLNRDVSQYLKSTGNPIEYEPR